jgi:hypothetical protein
MRDYVSYEQIENKQSAYNSVIDTLCLSDHKSLDTIPNDIAITYRSLHKILRNKWFNINRAIESLSLNKNEMIFEENSPLTDADIVNNQLTICEI